MDLGNIHSLLLNFSVFGMGETKIQVIVTVITNILNKTQFGQAVGQYMIAQSLSPKLFPYLNVIASIISLDHSLKLKELKPQIEVPFSPIKKRHRTWRFAQ